MAWVSVGSESLLTAYDGSCSIMKPLRGREVILFPDLGAEDSWTSKMLTLRKHGIDCSISSLRGIASVEDVANGYDLADYLVKWSVDEFQPRPNQTGIPYENSFVASFEIFDAANRHTVR